MKHVSIDLETLGKSANAAITQIGLAEFCPITGGIGRTTNIPVTADSGVIDPSTVSWWLGQNEGAQTDMRLAIEGGMSTCAALVELRQWVGDSDVYVWGNGATFDITILESAFDRANLYAPWQFYNVRDMRTIVHAAKELRGFDKDSIERVGTHHNAEADAVHQAKVISAAWQSLA